MDTAPENAKDKLHLHRMASLGTLLASICHEITNPVAYVRSNLEALNGYTGTLVHILRRYQNLLEDLRPKVSDEVQAELKLISDSVDLKFLMEDMPQLMDESIEGIDTITDIIYGLRNFSKDEGARHSETDIQELIDFVIKVLTAHAKGRCQFQRVLGHLPRIFLHQAQIKQVLLNLAKNALEASKDGDTVVIEAHINEGYLQIKVRDAGSGIAKSDLERVFDPFFSTKKDGDGTGLGLHISREIASAHGGTLEVQSEQGVGTTFTLRIPCRGERDSK